MTDEPHFRLDPVTLARYRALRYDPNAVRDGNVIPLESPFWSDEHDLTGTPYPAERIVEEESHVSIMMLLAARKDLWKYGEIRPELRGVWQEARALLPDWPGFERLTADQELLDFVARIERMADAFEAAFLDEADEVEMEEGPGGVRHVRTRYDLTKDRDD